MNAKLYLFITQIIVSALLILTALINITIGNGSTFYWTVMLVGTTCYLMKAPSYKRQNNDEVNQV
jgi:hypothetical protein